MKTDITDPEVLAARNFVDELSIHPTLGYDVRGMVLNAHAVND